MSGIGHNIAGDRAETIRTLVAESDAAQLTSIEKALEAGHELVAAKAECRHGEWLPFLEQAGVPERKAQRLMTLARSGLKSDTVSDLGGIKGALEFLSMRDSAVAAMNAARVGDAIDTRKLRSAIKQVDAIIMRFSRDEADKVIRVVDPGDAFLDAIEGRGLPKPGRHLEITARDGGGRITAIGVMWPSVEHGGFYYCAVMQHPDAPEEDATSHVVWTKRPVAGAPIIAGDIIFEPAWSFFETHMGAPATLWEFDEDGVLPEILADWLDLPFLIAESESGKKWRDADSAAASDLLSSAGITPVAMAA